MYKQVSRVARVTSRLVSLQTANTRILVSRYSSAPAAAAAAAKPAEKIFSQHTKAQSTTKAQSANASLYTASPPEISYLLTEADLRERLDIDVELEKAKSAIAPENREQDLHYQYDCWWFSDMLSVRKLTVPQAEQLIELAKKKGEFKLHMYSQLSHVYSRNGLVDAVRSVGRQFEESGGELDEDYFRDVMYAYFVQSKNDLVHATYVEMLGEGLRPQYSAYLIELEALENLSKNELIPALIDDIRKDGFQVPDAYVTAEDKKSIAL